MKKLLKPLLLILIIGSVLTSCKKYSYLKYKPAPIRNAEEILPLHPVGLKKSLEGENGVFVDMVSSDLRDDIIKLHKAGLKKLCSQEDDLYGYYTFDIKRLGTDSRAYGLPLLHIVLYGAPGFVGIPYYFTTAQIEMEFQIYDAKKNLVAKYLVKEGYQGTTAAVAMYWGYTGKNAKKVSMVKVHQKAFEKFNELIAKDAQVINEKLKARGTVKIEKSDVIGNDDNDDDDDIVLDDDKDITKQKGGGTGFLISQGGYIVTNYHVVEDASLLRVYITTDNKTTDYPAVVVSEDKTNDIAVIKIDTVFVSPGAIPYTFSDDYNVSDVVYTIGYPQPDIMGTAYKYTKGEISSLSGIENNTTMMQITTPLQPGNSGGPLFNSKGDVVGITTSTLNPFYAAKYQGNIPQNVNYAVKSDYIKPLIKQYMDKVENTASTLSLADQIKVLSKYTCLIKVY